MGCRVVHLTSVHYAFDNRIFHKECASLAAAGYDVTLIAQNAGGDIVGESVLLRALPPPRNRIERATKTMWQLYRAALRERGAIYHFHDPELMPVGWLLKLQGKRVIYDVHEDYTGTMADKQWIPRSLRGIAKFGVTACEQFFADRYDRVIAATPTIAQKFKSPKTAIVQNFPWAAELVCTSEESYGAREPIVAYVGALSNIRGLREMSEAVRIAAKTTPIRLITAGKVTAGADAIATDEDSNGLVEHFGMQTRPQVRDLLARARIGIVTLHPTGNYVNSQPTKLYEYMSAGLPVVASDFPVWRKVVDGAQCGLLVDPMNPAAIAEALVWLLQHPEEAEAMGRRAQKAVLESYSWEREAAVLAGIYRELLPNRAAAL
jgi:glycosyltransferase involved in cell wall biosynthesis